MFQRPFRILSLALTTIAVVCLVIAYFLVLQPETTMQLFWDGPIDDLHRKFILLVGAWMVVTGTMALLALFRPHRQRGLITLLIATHLALFVVDIVAIAQGLVQDRLIYVEIVYCVLICTLLIRFFPSEKQLELFRDAKELQKREKEEQKEQQKKEKQEAANIEAAERAAEKSIQEKASQEESDT